MSETGTTLESAFEGLIRRIVKEEIREALGQNNGHKEPRLTYTTEEAAKILGVHKSWLATAARKGDISCVRMGHYVNFTLDNLKAFIEKIKAEKT